MNFALLHCIGLYPTPNDELQLNFMGRMMRRFSYVPVGYSGHEDPDNLDVVKIAVAKGALLLERHVGLATDSVKLNKYSSSPDQAELWVKAALVARSICGGTAGEKRIGQAEIDSLLELSRGTYAIAGIKKGDAIRRQDVFFAMPCQEGQQAAVISRRQWLPPVTISRKMRSTSIVSPIR